MRNSLLSRLSFGVVLICASLLTTFSWAADLPAHFVYRGSLIHFPENRQEAGQEVKRFQIDAFVDQAADNELVMNYVISENGNGGWHWSQQFGSLTYNTVQNSPGGRAWMLLNNYDESEYEVVFRAPWFEERGQLAEGASWESNPFTFSVKSKENPAGAPSWQVNMKHNLSRDQKLVVASETGLVQQASQTLFMGQGQRFQLDWKLEEQLPLDNNAAAAIAKVWKSLADLQKELGVDLYVPITDLNADQLELTRAKLASLKSEAAGTPFESLVRKIELQTEIGEERADSMAALAANFVGKAAPDFQLTTMRNGAVAKEEYSGKPVVLHFWRYQDQSLKAPYGQTGYLDFLYNQREKSGVKVYGIAVDPRLGDPQTKRSALLQIKKTVRFMNLSYPVTLDDGEILRSFGNPQASAGELPLWVVLSPDGKVVHYFAGHYEVKPNEGLKELDSLLAELLEPAAEK
ncbi:MAG: redoxin domain-containing protein [Planctomycetaceae bacterium]